MTQSFSKTTGLAPAPPDKEKEMKPISYTPAGLEMLIALSKRAKALMRVKRWDRVWVQTEKQEGFVMELENKERCDSDKLLVLPKYPKWADNCGELRPIYIERERCLRLPTIEQLRGVIVKHSTSDSLNQTSALYKWICKYMLYANNFNENATELWLAYAVHVLIGCWWQDGKWIDKGRAVLEDYITAKGLGEDLTKRER